MDCRVICGIAQILQAVRAWCRGSPVWEDKSLPLLLRRERKGLAVSEGMPENYKYPMGWHLVVISSFQSFISRR